MALTVGELVAYAQLDKSGFSSGTKSIGTDLNKLQSETSSSMASMENSVVKSLSQIEKEIADGLDPASAIADLDRLEAELNASFAEMEREAEAFAAELEADIDKAFASLDDDAQESGKRAGDQLVDGLKTALHDTEQAGKRAGDDLTDGLKAGLKDAETIARDAGRDAGKKFGDGIEDGAGGGSGGGGGGAGGGGGGRMAGIGASMVGGLKMGGIGVALAAGAAIGAALMSGVEQALSQESALAKLSAQIGATESEMRVLGEAAGAAYVDGYGESMGDVTEAIKGLVQNVDGLRTASEETLTDLSKRAIDTGVILDEDVGKVTRAVAKILKTELAPNAEAAFDILVRGAQLGGNEAEDLLDTYSEYSTQFRTLGLSGQQAMGLIVQGLQAGARDADVVADAIKEFTIEAVQGGAKVKAGFTSLGLSADGMVAKFAAGGPTAAKAFDTVLDKLRNIEDPVKRNAIAVQLFGTKAEDLGQALYSLDPSSAVAKLGQVGGAAKTAGETLHDTATSKIESFKRGMQEGVVNFIGGTVIPALEDGWKAFDATGVPEMLGDFRDQAAEVWNGIVSDVRAWVSDNQETIDSWKAKFDEVMTSVKEVFEIGLANIQSLWDTWGDEILATLSFLVDTFLNIWNGFWGVVSGIFQTVRGLLTGDMEMMKEGLSKIWDSIWKGLEDTAETGGKFIQDFLGKTWDELKDDAEDTWSGMVTAVKNKIDDMIADVKAIPGQVKSAFAAAGTWLVQAGKDVINGFVQGIKAQALAPVVAAQGVIDNVVKGVKGVLDEHSPSKVFDNIGQNTILGFINGVVAKGQEAASTVAKMMDEAVVGTAKKATGTGTGGGGGGGGGGATPSTVMAEIGKYTIAGLIKGLTEEGANIKATVDKLVTDIKEGFKSQPDVVDGLLDFVRMGNKNLEGLALQREELVERLANAKEMAKKVAGDAQEWASLTGLKAEDLTGAGDMAAELMGKASAINNFANNIQALAKRGLNKATIQQLIDAGVEKGATFAEMLVGSDGSEIKALNKAQAAVDKASVKLGKSSADAMYDVGKKSGEGYLTGLQDSLKKLDAEMAKIVKALVAAIKKELKIKSPSQVMAEIGVFTMAGYIEGLNSMESDTLGAMTGLVGKAVSATSDAAIGSVGKAATSTMGSTVLNGATSVSHEAGVPAPPGGWGFAGSAPSGPPVINVDMTGAVIREEMDITKVSDGFGYKLAVLGI